MFHGRAFKEEVHEHTRRVSAYDLSDIEDALARHPRFSEVNYTVSADHPVNVIQPGEGASRDWRVGSFDDDEPVIEEEESTAEGGWGGAGSGGGSQ
jgi:hypothetical protein